MLDVREGNYRDNAALAALSVEEFGLPIAFYPWRRAILDAGRNQILDFQTKLHTFVAEDFAGTADEVMSQRVVNAIEGTYTTDGRAIDEKLVAGPSGYVELGAGFTADEQAAVFHQITVVLEDEWPYRVAPAALAELRFTDEERARVGTQLVESGFLVEVSRSPRKWLPYFRNVSNATAVTLPGIEDFSTDIFFVLRAVAHELAAAVNEVVDALATRAEQQKHAIDTALADAFGLSSAAAEAIAEAVRRSPGRLGPAPILDTEDRQPVRTSGSSWPTPDLDAVEVERVSDVIATR